MSLFLYVDTSRGVGSLAQEVQRAAHWSMLSYMILDPLAVLAFLNLNIPDASCFDLLLLSDVLLGIVERIIHLKLTIEVSLMHGIFVVYFFDQLIVAVGCHLLHGLIIDVTLHVVDRVLEVGVGRGRETIERCEHIFSHTQCGVSAMC